MMTHADYFVGEPLFPCITQRALSQLAALLHTCELRCLQSCLLPTTMTLSGRVRMLA